MKTHHTISVGITLRLWMNEGKTKIYTMLSIPIQEHEYLYLFIFIAIIKIAYICKLLVWCVNF